MKVCIYGAGAIGAHIGVLMKLAGVDVSVIARGANLEAIKENGLKLIIDGEEKVARMPAAKEPADLGPQDFVIVALKSHQAWDAADHMKPLLGPNTAVVTAQNGIPWWYFYGFEGQYANLQLESVDPRGRQWKAIGPERAIGCTVYPAAEIIGPGVVKHTYGDRYGLGEPTRKETERVKTLAGAFEAAGLEAQDLSRDPQRHLAEAVGQSLLQPDLGADARDARRRGDRSRHAHGGAQDDGRGRDHRPAHRRALPRRHRAPHQWRGLGRRAPHLACCRTSTRSARWSSTRCSRSCRRWAGSSTCRRRRSTSCWR